MTLIPFFVPSRTTPFALEFLQPAESNNNVSAGNTYTFATQNTGSAHPTRVIIAALSIGGPDAECSAVTIAGISATKVEALAAGATESQDAEIWAAAVPTGTTGDVVITVGADATRAHIGLFRMVGGNATATDVAEDSDAGGSTSAAIVIPAGGAGIGVGANANGATAFTWGNASEVDDDTVDAGGMRAGSAIISSSATVTLTGASIDQSMVLAAWGP